MPLAIVHSRTDVRTICESLLEVPLVPPFAFVVVPFDTNLPRSDTLVQRHLSSRGERRLASQFETNPPSTSPPRWWD